MKQPITTVSASTLDIAIDAVESRLASRQRECHFVNRDERSELKAENAKDEQALQELMAMRMRDGSI